MQKQGKVPWVFKLDTFLSTDPVHTHDKTKKEVLAPTFMSETKSLPTKL
jgi:hypothetical protein